MSKTLQNFYKSTITLDWTIGTGNFYVSAKPTPTNGWLVISPNNAATREIVTYTNTGTDANGDYITVSARGVGGTSEQTHTIGEPVRMNVTAEYWADMVNDINNIIAAGVADATTTSMGGVELATGAELIAGTDTSVAGHPLVAQPSIINTQIAAKIAAAKDIQVFTVDGTWTKPTGMSYVQVICVGAGGGGSGGRGGAATSAGGSGGGGGSITSKVMRISDLAATVAVTVGVGGAGSAGGGSPTLVASNGTSSSFGTHLVAYGGGGGAPSNANTGGTGAGTGGGGVAGDGTAKVGGVPASVSAANGIAGQGAGVAATSTTPAAALNAEYGGGSGGTSSSSGNQNSSNGGSSLFGAGGGGGGASVSGGSSTASGSGGLHGSYTAGSGGTAGVGGTSPTAGGAGTSRSGYGCGDGGGGGGGTSSGANTAGAGGNGGAPGGGAGGGGAGNATATGGAGGTGGRGEVRVFSW